MLNLVVLEPHGVVPWHSHPHEQLGMVHERPARPCRRGRRARARRPNDAYAMPGGVEHEGLAGPDGRRRARRVPARPRGLPGARRRRLTSRLRRRGAHAARRAPRSARAADRRSGRRRRARRRRGARRAAPSPRPAGRPGRRRRAATPRRGRRAASGAIGVKATPCGERSTSGPPTAMPAPTRAPRSTVAVSRGASVRRGTARRSGSVRGSSRSATLSGGPAVTIAARRPRSVRVVAEHHDRRAGQHLDHVVEPQARAVELDDARGQHVAGRRAHDARADRRRAAAPDAGTGPCHRVGASAAGLEWLARACARGGY